MSLSGNLRRLLRNALGLGANDAINELCDAVDNATTLLGSNTAAENAVLAGASAGTVIASKAVVADANKDVVSFRRLGADFVTETPGSATSAGTVFANATQLSGAFNKVTNTVTNRGVILDPGYVGALHTVVNTSATNDLKVYPPAGASLDFGTVAVTLGTRASMLLKQHAADQFYRVGTLSL